MRQKRWALQTTTNSPPTQPVQHLAYSSTHCRITEEFLSEDKVIQRQSRCKPPFKPERGSREREQHASGIHDYQPASLCTSSSLWHSSTQLRGISPHIPARCQYWQPSFSLGLCFMLLQSILEASLHSNTVMSYTQHYDLTAGLNRTGGPPYKKSFFKTTSNATISKPV